MVNRPGQNLALVASKRANDARNLHPNCHLQREVSIFEYLKRETLAEFHSGGAQQRANSFGRASLASDYFTQIFRRNPQLKNGHLRALYGIDSHTLRMIYQGFGNLLNEGSFIWALASASNRRSSPRPDPSSAKRSASEFKTWT